LTRPVTQKKTGKFVGKLTTESRGASSGVENGGDKSGPHKAKKDQTGGWRKQWEGGEGTSETKKGKVVTDTTTKELGSTHSTVVCGNAVA